MSNKKHQIASQIKFLDILHIECFQDQKNWLFFLFFDDTCKAV